MPANNKIRSAYVTLPSAERKVADFILDNPDRAMRMVINEIAEAAGVSVPSVTRLARRLGYKGFLDFRVALAGEGYNRIVLCEAGAVYAHTHLVAKGDGFHVHHVKAVHHVFCQQLRFAADEHALFAGNILRRGAERIFIQRMICIL